MTKRINCKTVISLALCMVMMAGILFPYNVHAASKVVGLVSESEYLSKYTNKEDYKAVPYYRYATRTKETKTSGYSSLSGWNQSGKELVSSQTFVGTGNWVSTNDSFETVYETIETFEAQRYSFYTCEHKTHYAWVEGYAHGSCKLDKFVSVWAAKKWDELKYPHPAAGTGWGWDQFKNHSFVVPKSFSVDNPKGFGRVYAIRFEGKFISEWNSNSDSTIMGSTFVDTNGIMTEKKYRYSYWRWSDWSDWSDWTADVKATGDTCKKDDTVMYYVTDIRKAEQTISGKSLYSVKCGDEGFNLNCSASGGGTLKYSSDNSSIVSVDSYGGVQINGAGTAWITVTASETSDYKSAQKKIQITVEKRSQTISIDEDDFEVLLGSDIFSLNAWADSGMLSYKSSNTKILTVSSSGKVKVKRLGKAKVYVTALSDSEYKSATRTVWVTVVLKTPCIEYKNGYGKIKFTWDKVPGASGYKVYSYDKNKKKYICKMTRKSSQRYAVIREPKIGKEYKVKVRAYKNVNGKKVYSTYSNVVKVTGK